MTKKFRMVITAILLMLIIFLFLWLMLQAQEVNELVYYWSLVMGLVGVTGLLYGSVD